MQFLCLDFLNSDWYDGRGQLEDRLQRVVEKALLATIGLSRGTHLPTPRPKEMKSLLRLRVVLREIVSQVAADRSPSASPVDRLNSVLRKRAAFPVLVKVGHRVDLGTDVGKKNWTWVLVPAAETTAQLLVHAALRGVKVCVNEGCHWAFYDQSKGRTRRWCDG